jgi:hypothetical protein
MKGVGCAGLHVRDCEIEPLIVPQGVCVIPHK